MLVPSRAPRIDTAMRERRIKSATVSEVPDESCLSKKREIIKNTTESMAPHSAPTGTAARFFLAPAKPAQKYDAMQANKPKGAYNASGEAENAHITVPMSARATEHTAPTHTPNADAPNIPLCS